MDAIREQLIYKEGKVQICMKDLSAQEQYELIRLLLATRTKDVLICKHNSINTYINTLLDNLIVDNQKLEFTECATTGSVTGSVAS
jgi:hypothetical protein